MVYVFWEVVHILWLLSPFAVSGLLGTLLLVAFRLAVTGAGNILRKDFRRGVRALGLAILTLMGAAAVTALLYWLLLVIIGPQVGR